MTEFYRFRSIEQLLGDKFAELERQTIFFAAPEDLNDPMEGLHDIVWVGDQIVWQNLFKNYVDFLHWHFQNAVTLGVEVLSDPQSIPYLPGWQNDLAPQRKVSSQFIWAMAKNNDRMHHLVSRLAETRRRVRREELILCLRAVHAYSLLSIREVYIRIGVISAEDWPYTPGHDKPPVTPIELHDQLEEWEDSKAAAMMRAAANSEAAHLFQVKLDAFRNTPHLMSRIPTLYVDYLRRLSKPNWYTACFAKGFNNSSMWGHYGDGHKGACLIFEAEETANGASIALKEGTVPNSRGAASAEAIVKTFPFYRIRYGGTSNEVEFFRSLTNQPSTYLRESWYTDDHGNMSDCAGLLDAREDGDLQIKRDLGAFYQDITFKTRDWEYEQEYRLVLDPGNGGALDSHARTLTYDFMSLKGIVFGLGMSDEHREKIRDIITRKCAEIRRGCFEFYDAYYSPVHGDIQGKMFWMMPLYTA